MTRNERRPGSEGRAPQPAKSADCALIIFAKAPVAGQVNTRLCPPLTADEAATLQGSFILDTLERSRAAIQKFRLPITRYLACSPSSTHVFFQIMAERHGVQLLEQTGENLGERMHTAFIALFAKGFTPVLIVGTDVPSLPLQHYQQAVTMLRAHELVLGPAEDGGYYLVGLTRPVPELFRDISWSTDQVLAQTRERAQQAGLRTSLLPVWRDVDTIEDLQALIEANRRDMKQPKQERVFSTRTGGALDVIAKRLRLRLQENEATP
ncbi:MAG: TIGR04282 family arsenosugar biosynthesis glycosyltransferase [Nitrospiraceae bacterium]